MTGGSQQLRLFRRQLADGAHVDEAAAVAGIGLAEARMIAADDARTPPPADACRLLGLSETLYALCGPWGRA